MALGAHRLHTEFTHAKKHLGLDLLIDNNCMFTIWGWRDGSMTKTTHCSCRRPGMDSQHHMTAQKVL